MESRLLVKRDTNEKRRTVWVVVRLHGAAMTVSDFTMCESKVREAAATGTLVDLRVGDSSYRFP